MQVVIYEYGIQRPNGTVGNSGQNLAGVRKSLDALQKQRVYLDAFIVYRPIPEEWKKL
jgi:hypothetical protein